MDKSDPLQVPLLERSVDTGLQRSTRTRRLPVRFRDPLPVAPVYPSRRGGAQNQHEKGKNVAEQPLLDERIDSEDAPGSSLVITTPNSFGVFREYLTVSSHNPQSPDAFADVLTAPPLPQSIGSGLVAVPPTEPAPDPFANSENKSTDLLLAWMAMGLGSTPAGMNSLVHDILRNPNFDLSELEGFNAVTAMRRFDRDHFSKSSSTLKAGDGWKEGSVRIRVPCTRIQQREVEAPEFVVDGILYRDIVEVITAELEDADAFEHIHVTPYKESWRPRPTDDPIRVYSETYNSDAMLHADKKMRDKLNTTHGPDGDLEAFVVSALLYSDSTHLASFGNASLWPVYLFLGNISKYIRSRPTSFAAHHVAYIPTVCSFNCFPIPRAASDQIRQLPDSIKEFYREQYGVDPNSDMLTHLGRELTHGVLRLILGGSFADACKHFQRVKCGDNILRRWLLELLLHSADYKEKCVYFFLQNLFT